MVRGIVILVLSLLFLPLVFAQDFGIDKRQSDFGYDKLVPSTTTTTTTSGGDTGNFSYNQTTSAINILNASYGLWWTNQSLWSSGGNVSWNESYAILYI